MKNSIKYIIGICIGILLVSFLLFKIISLKKEADIWKNNYNTEKTSFETYKTEYDGKTAYYKSQIQLTAQDLRRELQSNDSLKEIIKHYKRPETVTIIETKFVHDTINVPKEVYVEIGRDTTIKIGDLCFNAKINYLHKQLSISDFTVPNEQTIVTGLRKTGFLKKEYSFDVKNSNPCLVVTGMTSYKVTTKPKFWENPVYAGLLGVVVGIVIDNRINK
jgi:hypothetical protein